MSHSQRTALGLFQRLMRSGVNFLFPPRCPGCKKPGVVWCDQCQARVQPVGRIGCQKCGFNHLLGKCLAEGDYPVRVRSYARYLPPLTQAILELKYRPNRALAEVLSTWLLELYLESGWVVDRVISVPLAVARKRQRGYNQIELIASPFAEALDLPLDRNTLTRVRDTGSQVGLDHVARRSNLEGAFRADPQRCLRRTFLLLDDLITSGATIRACSEALYAAGASAVYGLTIARADRKFHKGGLV